MIETWCCLAIQRRRGQGCVHIECHEDWHELLACCHHAPNTGTQQHEIAAHALELTFTPMWYCQLDFQTMVKVTRTISFHVANNLTKVSEVSLDRSGTLPRRESFQDIGGRLDSTPGQYTWHLQSRLPYLPFVQNHLHWLEALDSLTKTPFQ